MTYQCCMKIDPTERLADLTRKCLHAATVAMGRGDVSVRHFQAVVEALNTGLTRISSALVGPHCRMF